MGKRGKTWEKRKNPKDGKERFASKGAKLERAPDPELVTRILSKTEEKLGKIP